MPRQKTLNDRLAQENFAENLAERTILAYGRSIERIKKLLQKEGESMSLENLAGFIERNHKTGKCSKGYMRLLKAAVLYHITEQAQASLDAGENIDHETRLYETIQNIGGVNLPIAGESGQTPSKRLKFFPKDIVDALIKWESNKRRCSGPAGDLIAFLRANLQVGLRPQEWFDTKFDHDSNVITMTIRNARYLSGWEDGYSRTIELREITSDDLATLIHFHKLVEGFKEKNPQATPTEFYQPLSRCLQYAVRKLRPKLEKYPVLYSTRYQVITNARWSKLSDLEIASMFGYPSVETAKQYYGKHSDAWGRVTFRPSESSLQRVKKFVPRVRSSATPILEAHQIADELILTIRERGA